MVEGTFPYIKSTQGWLSRGELPFELRGDASSLPLLHVKTCANQTEVSKAIEAFKSEQRDYLLREDRRVAYVALTRPKQKLLLSGSKWKAGLVKPVEANDYLKSAALINDHRVVVIDKSDDPLNPLPNYPEIETNPVDESAISETWPMEPLGEKHRKKIEVARELVENAISVRAPSRLEIDGKIDLLLAEQVELKNRSKQVRLPVRIPASRFKEFIYDLPKIVDMYRRPLPEQPYRQTMAGTLFHAWVEQRFGVLATSDELDAIELSKEDESTQKTVEELREIFEGSRFASMTPHSIESEIQVTIKGNTFICKLDAVFKTDRGFEIVDWKTGKPPIGEKEIAERALQLALYRMAFSRIHQVDPSLIEVCLYYVADNLEIKPEQVPSEEELIALWESVLANVVD
jgi:DNA helicase-2/ATP-dependent DNA helicase PcrA